MTLNRLELVYDAIHKNPAIRFNDLMSETKLKNGADIIEIGMPFSDPMADGPIIQKANDRALKNKVNLDTVFKMVSKFRKEDKLTPLILMGYYNPIHRYGINNFIKNLKKNKVDGVIIVDLPPEEDKELCLPVIKSCFVICFKLVTVE